MKKNCIQNNILLTSFCLIFLSIISILLIASCSNQESLNDKIINSISKDDIALIYTNDVHGTSTKNIGIDGLSHIKHSVENKTNNVLTIDGGDFAVGPYISKLSNMQFPATMMNKIDYDYAILGNHEQDQNMEDIKNFINTSGAQFLSCNYNDINLKHYDIKNFGDIKIAFIGITSVSDNDDASQLFQIIQNDVNNAKAEGAQLVIAISHLGESKKVHDSISSDLVAENTYDIDAILDAHSHSAIECMNVSNKNGNEIKIMQAGSYLSHVGIVKINKNKELSFNLIKDYQSKDNDITQFMSNEKEKYGNDINQVVSKSDYNIPYHGEGNMVALSREDPLGNLISDSYKTITKADCALVNATAYRSDLPEGDITKENICDIFPFESNVVTIKVTGQQIMDALEHSYRYVQKDYRDEDDNPIGTNSGFLQVSGLKFDINTNIKSSVQFSGRNNFAGVADKRRIENIQIQNNENWENLDCSKEYTLATSAYLADGGCGMSMLNVANKIDHQTDTQILCDYINNHLYNKVKDKYSNTDERINVIS